MSIGKLGNNPQIEKSKYRKYGIILTAVLLMSLGANAYLFWDNQKIQKDIGASIQEIKNQYKFLDPAQGFYDQEDLIVNIQPLREQLTAIGENKNISIYFEYLPSGANIAVNKDLAFWPGSLMKIPVAMAVMKKIEDGQWKLENELVLLAQDKSPEFGDLYKQPVGTRFTIEHLLEEMLIHSDNTARTIFMRNLEPDDTFKVAEHLGIEDIFNQDQEVGAKKYSIFWRSLYTSSYLSPEHSEKLINIMTKTPFENYLNRGLPQGTVFSHKIGVNAPKNIYEDSGIVYTPERPYILTVMMQENNHEKMEQLMKDISQKIYNYVSLY